MTPAEITAALDAAPAVGFARHHAIWGLVRSLRDDGLTDAWSVRGVRVTYQGITTRPAPSISAALREWCELAMQLDAARKGGAA